MRKSVIATLVCGAMILNPVAASAFSGVVPAVATGSDKAAVIQVKKGHHHHHHHHHRHRHRGSAFGAGLAVGIIGALIAKGISESAARERYDRCARDFRSFDYETGTIITRSGREVLCPYLR
ncbi:MAG: hypothetical protein WBB38_13225 [Hyphomicrobiaceae bacterium]|jgi:Predicted Zn-dependent protease